MKDPNLTTGFMKEGLEPNHTGFMKPEGFIDPNKHRIYEGRTRS